MIVATKKPKISIYLPDAQKVELEVEAIRQKRSISNLVEVIIDEWLEKQKAKNT